MKSILYGSTISPFVRKVKVMLLEKGIEHDQVEVNLAQPAPEFVAISPLKKIPVLQDEDGRVINDSSVIAAYLDERYPKKSFVSADLYERARARWFEEYADAEMGPKLLPIFAQRILNVYMRKLPLQQEVVDAALQAAPNVLGYLEKELGDNQYFVGNKFSLADISIASVFCTLRYADFSVDEKKFPKLAKFVANVLARPSFAGLIAGEQAFINKLKSK